MKVLADENVPRGIIKLLRQEGFDIVSVDEENKGIEDREVLELAEKENMKILTFDTDFLGKTQETPGIFFVTEMKGYSSTANAISEAFELF